MNIYKQRNVGVPAWAVSELDHAASTVQQNAMHAMRPGLRLKYVVLLETWVLVEKLGPIS